jgi:sugar phosphate isomerase/epimerase
MEIFVNTDCELEEDYIRGLRSILDTYGTKCVSLHPYTCPIEPMMFFSNYERRVEDGIKYYRKFFKAMNLLGADIFVFHGNKAVVPVEENLYFERYLKLAQVGREYGVTVAQENVVRCQCNTLHFMVNMVKQLGSDVKFVVDLKQAIRSKVSVYDIIESVGENIAHVHISDHTSEKDCLPVGSGILDMPKLLHALEEKSFNGVLMLELYRNNFSTVDELVNCYQYLENIVINN